MSAEPFLIIGENIHASRIVLRAGKHVARGPDGREALVYADRNGARRYLAIPEPVLASRDGEKGRIKHVLAALRAGLTGSSADGDDARGYLRSLAARQVQAGAAWLDLNADEFSTDDAERQQAMRWLVGVIEAVAPVPLSLDSSSPSVLEAGLDACGCLAGPPLINSASLERLEVLDLAARSGSPVVLSAAGVGGLPAGATERVENAMRLIEAAAAKGITGGRVFVDPLVLPAAVRSGAAVEFLEAVRELRRRLGSEVHITGGLSNVSFGLPARRLLNEVFLALAREAGADSGIIDPVASAPNRQGPGPGTRPWQLATDLLQGRDPVGRAFLKAYRTNELAAW